jgi:hypothetical protein
MEKSTNLSSKELVSTNQDTSGSNTEEEEEEDEESVRPVVQMPPSHFSNVSVQNSSNVHFGNSAVYNGDVTVILGAGVDDLVVSTAERLQIKGGDEQFGNLDDDQKKKMNAINAVLGVLPSQTNRFEKSDVVIGETSKFLFLKSSFYVLMTNNEK